MASTEVQGEGAKASGRLLRAWRSYVRDPLYRDSLWLMLNTAIIAGSGFVFWLVAARLASPDDVGLGGALLGALMLVSMIARLGFDISLLKALPSAERAHHPRIIDTALTVTTLASLVVAASFVLGTPWWSPSLAGLRQSPAAAVTFALLTAIVTIGQMTDSILLGMRRADAVLAKNAVHSVAKVLSLFLLAPLLGVQGILIAAAGTVLLGLALAARPLSRSLHGHRPRLSLDRSVLQSTITSSFSNYAVAFLLGIPLSIGMLIVLQRTTAADAALYYVLWMFGSVGMVGAVAFGQTSLVEMSKTRNYAVALRPRFLVSTTLMGLLVLAGGLVALPLFGAHYSSLGWSALLPFALSTIPGYFLHARLAQFRAAGAHLGLLVASSVTVGTYVAGLCLAPQPVQMSGWLWAASLALGAITGFLFRLEQPQTDV